MCAGPGGVCGRAWPLWGALTPKPEAWKKYLPGPGPMGWGPSVPLRREAGMRYALQQRHGSRTGGRMRYRSCDRHKGYSPLVPPNNQAVCANEIRQAQLVAPFGGCPTHPMSTAQLHRTLTGWCLVLSLPSRSILWLSIALVRNRCRVAAL